MTKRIKDNPQIELLFQLQRVNQIYNSYGDIDTKEDFEQLIYYYQKKDSFSKKELEKLQRCCQEEWNELLILICNSIINKIGKTKTKRKIFAEEFDDAQELLQKIKNNDLRLENYEQIYDSSLQRLKKKFDSKWEKERIEWKRFWIGMLIGFILGIIGSFLVGIILN
ncbi:hypothetical protein GOV12_05615 [Candidatus Pacearchaeota archaeon]|nr:hypothetical protein [Candidatus Pacearchaeota archaeon]